MFALVIFVFQLLLFSFPRSPVVESPTQFGIGITLEPLNVQTIYIYIYCWCAQQCLFKIMQHADLIQFVKIKLEEVRGGRSASLQGKHSVCSGISVMLNESMKFFASETTQATNKINRKTNKEKKNTEKPCKTKQKGRKNHGKHMKCKKHWKTIKKQ